MIYGQYPDMRLYQEIIFLDQYFKGWWVVENVIPYYKPLIQPTLELERHLFWANFKISKNFHLDPITGFIDANFSQLTEWLGYHDFKDKIYLGKNHDPCQILRNCVHPELGLHILNCALGKPVLSKTNQSELWAQ